MTNTIFLVVIGAVLAYAGYTFWSNWRAATGSTWQRLLAASKNSATILWSYLVMAGSTLMGWSINMADAMNLPDVRSFIQAHLSPETFAATLFAVALLTVFARLRTL